jgi:hypothetical protein
MKKDLQQGMHQQQSRPQDLTETLVAMYQLLYVELVVYYYQTRVQ